MLHERIRIEILMDFDSCPILVNAELISLSSVSTFYLVHQKGWIGCKL
jgi:hypothetical protein